MNYTRCLAKVIRNKNPTRKVLDECKCNQYKIPTKIHWQTYLRKRVDDLVEISCCSSVSHPLLMTGIGTSRKITRLLRQGCVNNTYDECGVDGFLNMSTYTVLGECNINDDCLDWIHANQQGKIKR